jgi:hypothetical protein
VITLFSYHFLKIPIGPGVAVTGDFLVENLEDVEDEAITLLGEMTGSRNKVE